MVVVGEQHDFDCRTMIFLTFRKNCLYCSYVKITAHYSSIRMLYCTWYTLTVSTIVVATFIVRGEKTCKIQRKKFQQLALTL